MGDDEKHFIQFTFKCRTRGQKGYRFSEEERHGEVSEFRKVEGKWLFLGGVSQQIFDDESALPTL